MPTLKLRASSSVEQILTLYCVKLFAKILILIDKCDYFTFFSNKYPLLAELKNIGATLALKESPRLL